MRNKKRVSSLVVVFLTAIPAFAASGAQADRATFRFDAVSLRPYVAAYLGNGTIGLETTALGTAGSNCFLAGVYDHTRGDVARIASAPQWNELDVSTGSDWLNSSSSPTAIEQYRQTLDMYDGVLRTSYVWADGGKRIRIQAEEFVSRDRSGTAAIRMVLTPEFTGQIEVRLPLKNGPMPHRYLLDQITKLEGEAATNPWAIWYPGRLDVSRVRSEASANSVLMSLLATAPGKGTVTGEAVAAEWTGKANVEKHDEAEGTSALLTLDIKAGVSYAFTKFVAFASGGDRSTADEEARNAVLKIGRAGWQTLLDSNVAAWHKLWATDIVVDGDAALQRTIHSMLFYLLGSTGEGLSVSTPPMGLSSAGYYGHIFWDADTFLFPPLLVLHPELARPMVAFRSRTREAARENAKKNGYQGAMYPWEADADGEESTPRFAIQNAKYENHVNGDVALGAWRYWLATGDRKWLEQNAWPILRDTADFWVSRVDFNAKLNRYEIGKVVAVDESKIGVSNDAYTNAVAKENLRLAIKAAGEVHQAAHSKWADVAEKLYVPESDSALLWFPLDLKFSPEATRKAVDGEVKKIHAGETGAMMNTEFYPILAAQLGDRSLIGRIMEPLWKPYLRPPFQVIAETPKNENTSFITGAGAFLQQFVFGYSGFRLGDDGLEKRFRSVLPPGVRRMTLKNVVIRGKRETMTFDAAN